MKNLDKYLLFIQEQPAETTTSTLMATAKSNGMKQENEFSRRAYDQCRQQVGEEQKACKDSFKQQALNAMARAYQDQVRNCGRTKNPGECRQRISDAANKYLEKARAIRV